MRANPDTVAGLGIDDITTHYAEPIASLPSSPILTLDIHRGVIL
jgi:hypothetical protein